jgi:putative peptide zinc metalloprotease protein
MAAIALPIVAMALILLTVLKRFVGAVWRRSAGSQVRRAGAGALVATLAAVLAFAWWPNAERYQPIRPYEGGTLLNAVAAPLSAMGYEVPASPVVRGGEVSTVLPNSRSLPTEAAPQLAMVLVPEGSLGSDAGSQTDSATGTAQASWVFPFNKPLPPEPGDNQAFATNTTDNSVTYDVAFAWVWVTGEDPVLNVNEAYAFASCSDCVTVAVAFQVVVIVGRADVIVPQNLSAAVNYECFECVTASVASQLVVTVDALPGVERQIALADIWGEIMAFAATIPTRPLAEVIAQLDDYKQQILEILGLAPAATSTSTPMPSGTPATSPTNPGAAPPADDLSSSTPEPTPLPNSSPPAVTPSSTHSPEPTPTVTPEPTTSPPPSPGPSGG